MTCLKCRAAIYGRVSTEHEEQQESIRVQMEALSDYANNNGFEIARQYVDEGYSGTNFDRPGIKGLREDILSGAIDVVLIKDLSRLGRNNPETLLFMDFLTENNVRLIAINDNYDSLRGEDDLVGIKTWFNERYSRELSSKIKFALKHKKSCGEYVTAFAPYGYKKSDTVRNKLEVDEYAANVVKYIFELYINGYGYTKIAHMLQNKGIPTPSSYCRYGKHSTIWDWTTIRRIISNPVYMGHSIQQRYLRKNFKSKKVSAAPEKLWIKVYNTHEPVIEESIYKLAQEIHNKRNKETKKIYGRANLHDFTSILYCHECGKTMYYKDKGYMCGKYVRLGRKGCSSHYISEEELKEIVSREIGSVIEKNINIPSLSSEILEELNRNTGSVFRDIKNIEHSISAYKYKVETLYRDKLDNLISEEIFARFYNEFSAALSLLEREKEEALISANEAYSQNSMCQKEIQDKIIEFSRIPDRELIESLIERIEVFETGEILIRYRFKV